MTLCQSVNVLSLASQLPILVTVLGIRYSISPCQ